MANKDSLVIQTEYYDILDSTLNDEQMLVILRAMFLYKLGRKLPAMDDITLGMWFFVKAALDNKLQL